MGKEIKVEKWSVTDEGIERETAMLESSGEDAVLMGNKPVHCQKTRVQQRDELRTGAHSWK